MFRALLSILVYVPSRDFSMVAVNAQLSQPYSKMDSTVATKNLLSNLLASTSIHVGLPDFAHIIEGSPG